MEKRERIKLEYKYFIGHEKQEGIINGYICWWVDVVLGAYENYLLIVYIFLTEGIFFNYEWLCQRDMEIEEKEKSTK